jgi:flavin reductase (DIM6/NTAB) family NADH-FMN oxidoreductase RutF
MNNPTAPVSPEHYRKVMGRLPTGVVAITGVEDDGNDLGRSTNPETPSPTCRPRSC